MDEENTSAPESAPEVEAAPVPAEAELVTVENIRGATVRLAGFGRAIPKGGRVRVPANVAAHLGDGFRIIEEG